MKKIIFLILSLGIAYGMSIEAKPAELKPSDVTSKMYEIMKAHAAYKALTPQIVKRAISNFIDFLDPGKTYFLESEIDPWLTMNDQELQKVIEQFEKGHFSTFENIFDQFKKAIVRRRDLESRLDKDALPDDVAPKEFKELVWAQTENELYERLKRLRAIQIEVAAKIGKEVKDTALQRLKKRRLKIEDEIVTPDNKLAQAVLCTYILKAFAASLDAHTTYFTPAEATQFLIEVQKRLFGIGVQFRDDVDGFTIVKIVEGGPADREKSLHPKDKIIAVNGEPIMGLDIVEVVELIRGAENTPVLLRVVRAVGEGKTKKHETFDVKIVRGEVVLKETRVEAYPVPFGKGAIAYLRLHSFYQDEDTSSTEDLKKAYRDIAKDNTIIGCVLDLRYNSGGLLPQAVSVSGLFLKPGIIVSIRDEMNDVHHFRNLEPVPMWDGPMIVLVNRASASAAEIVAQALKDYGRAILCGDDHTFGKGSYQTFTLNPMAGSTVDPEGEYKVTRGRYYTVSGKTPQLVGVPSDIIVSSGLSLLDIGEAYAKYPLENDSIAENFQDGLSDVPLFQRDRIRKLYQLSRQKRLVFYDSFIPQLKKNSTERMKNNKSYQTFIEEVEKSEKDFEEIDTIERYPDFQLYEGMNVMRDLIMLIDEQRGIIQEQNLEQAA